MYQITTLDNGLKIITYKQPGVSSVYVDIKVAAGSKYCPKGKEGLPHFVEHMVMNGTKNYPSGLDVTRVIQNLGGKINASVWKESVDYWVKVLHKDLEKAAEVLFPLVVSPLLLEKELVGERKIILEEIARAQDSLGRKVSDALFKLVFDGHPLSHPGLGYPETLARIEHSDITSFVPKFYVPGNMVITAVGDVPHGRFIDLVKDYFSVIRNRPVPAYSRFEYRPSGPRAVVLPEESKQASLILSFPSSPQTLHAHMVERFLVVLLFSRDRLAARLREKENLAYSVGMRHFRIKDLFLPSVVGGFSYSEVGRSVSIICEELSRLKESKVPSAEFRKIKKLMEVDLLFDLEAPEGWAKFIMNWDHFLGKPVEPNEFLEGLARVSVDDLRTLAQKIFVPENSYLSVSHRSITSKELEDTILKGLS
ncbi:MAG: pitrilysin family protein [Patescibacteria group bacterium]|nr:MAG: pitrilysin family protein [Patescibacteria group bacterium]